MPFAIPFAIDEHGTDMFKWDRAHDWVLERFWYERTCVALRFQQSTASVRELLAIRRCLPQFRNMAPAALRAFLGDTGLYCLGELPAEEANNTIRACTAQGINVIAEDASFFSYLPIDRTTGCAWIIEDKHESAALAKAMIAAGVPVQDVDKLDG